jgi:hypothetical protein
MELQFPLGETKEHSMRNVPFCHAVDGAHLRVINNIFFNATSKCFVHLTWRLDVEAHTTLAGKLQLSINQLVGILNFLTNIQDIPIGIIANIP